MGLLMGGLVTLLIAGAPIGIALAAAVILVINFLDVFNDLIIFDTSAL